MLILVMSVGARFYREDVTKSFTLGADSRGDFVEFKGEAEDNS